MTTFTNQVFWSENGTLLCVANEEEAYILQYNPDKCDGTPPDDDGFEEAFDVLGEVSDKVMTGMQ